jgi:chromosome segregation protein
VALETSVRALDWQRERAVKDREELSAQDKRECRLQGTLCALEQQEREVRDRLVNREERWRSLGSERARSELEAVRTAFAVGQEALRRERERLSEYRVRRQQTIRRATQLAQRESNTVDELAALQSEIHHLAQREETTSSRLLQLDQQEREIKENLCGIRSREHSLARTERDLRQRVRVCEGRANQASLAEVRCEDEIHRLQDHILRDLGPTHLDGLDEVYRFQELPTQASLPLESSVSSLPMITELPEGLVERIDLLRGRLGRLRHINPDAPAEYAELKRRYEFLSDQAADLKAAADSIRQVVAELDQVMESRFRRTFEAVAAQFAEHFSFLFGGGQAQLILTEPRDLAHTGVDVRVCPPGKREQGLALLSGGERALAAVALVFAFLSVSPTPFCVLDEVDATLDEANSARFRHLVERLAEHTQFVIITHNRRTIEAAGTVYGVSMDEDGVSQVMSLRLDEVPAAVVG